MNAKELASVFRAEACNVGGPLQGSLLRMADALANEASGITTDTPFRGSTSATFSTSAATAISTDPPKPESDTTAPTDDDSLET